MENYNIIFINGEPFNCSISMSLKEVLIYLGFKIEDIIVECNKKIIIISEFDKFFFNNLDNIEIITITGGG